MAKIKVGQVSEAEDGTILVAIPPSIAEKLDIEDGDYIAYSNFLGMIVIKKIPARYLKGTQTDLIELALMPGL